MRFINGGDDVVWSVAAILTSFRPFRPITATIPMVTAIVIAVVVVVSVVGSLIAAASWAMSAHILIEAYFGLFGINILIGSRNHLANPLWWLVIEFGVKVAVMESLDKGGDDFCFRDVGNRIPHLRKLPNVATEELE